MIFSWSIDDSDYFGSENSRENAIKTCIEENELQVGQEFWVGGGEPKPLSSYCRDIDLILDDIKDKAEEQFDDAASAVYWIDKVDYYEKCELESMIKSAMDKWATRFNYHPKFYEIDAIEKYTVKEEDIIK